MRTETYLKYLAEIVRLIIRTWNNPEELIGKWQETALHTDNYIKFLEEIVTLSLQTRDDFDELVDEKGNYYCVYNIRECIRNQQEISDDVPEPAPPIEYCYWCGRIDNRDGRCRKHMMPNHKLRSEKPTKGDSHATSTT